MVTVAAIYTAQALVEPLTEVFSDECPDTRLINIVDGGLIQDIIAENGVSVSSARRLFHCYMNAVDAGADVILNTCSSVGDVVEHARWFVPIPILKIDASMAASAVNAGSSIGVLATLPTTLSPTVRLVEATAREAKRQVEIIDGLADGAFQALISGNPAEHDRILMDTAKRVAGSAEVIVLAQGSMARMEEAIAGETGKPVFSSVRSGVRSVKEYLESTAR